MVRNERLKLLAATLNNLGLAFMIGGLVAPSIGGQLLRQGAITTLAWFAFGAGLHLVALWVLGRMRE